MKTAQEKQKLNGWVNNNSPSDGVGDGITADESNSGFYEKMETALKVLKNILKKAGLKLGVEVAEQLIKECQELSEENKRLKEEYRTLETLYYTDLVLRDRENQRLQLEIDRLKGLIPEAIKEGAYFYHHGPSFLSECQEGFKKKHNI